MEGKAIPPPPNPDEALFLFNDREVEVRPDFSHTVRTHWLLEARGPGWERLVGPVMVAPFLGRDEFEVEWAFKLSKGRREALRNLKGIKLSIGGRPTYFVKRLRIPLPPLSPGERLDICFVLRRRYPLIPGHFFVTHIAQKRAPVMRARFSLRTPVGMRYFWKAYGRSPSIRTEKVAGEERRDLTWRNLPPVGEGGSPAGVVVGTASSWEPILDWLGRLFRPKVVVDEDIRKLAQKLASKAKGREAKIEALWEFVVKGIIPVPSPSPFEPRPAPVVLRTRVGDCKDKAILLLALLKAAGVEGALLRFVFGGCPNPPNPHALFHVLVEVDGKLLDPSGGSRPDWRRGAKLILRL